MRPLERPVGEEGGSLLPESGAHQGPVGLLGTLLRVCPCVCVCVSVRSINA